MQNPPTFLKTYRSHRQPSVLHLVRGECSISDYYLPFCTNNILLRGSQIIILHSFGHLLLFFLEDFPIAPLLLLPAQPTGPEIDLPSPLQLELITLATTLSPCLAVNFLLAHLTHRDALQPFPPAPHRQTPQPKGGVGMSVFVSAHIRAPLYLQSLTTVASPHQSVLLGRASTPRLTPSPVCARVHMFY